MTFENMSRQALKYLHYRHILTKTCHQVSYLGRHALQKVGQSTEDYYTILAGLVVHSRKLAGSKLLDRPHVATYVILEARLEDRATQSTRETE